MRQRTEIWFIVFILIFLGVIFSLPLIFNLNSTIPYSFYPASGSELLNMKQGDHLQIFYTLSQVSDYFRERNSAFFEEPYEFTISGSKRYYSPRELPLSVLFFFLSPLGNIVAYNILVILSFVACGVSVFLLSGRYIKSFLARLVSGIIFAIFPFRLAQLYGGHPNGFMVFFLPLMLYGYESWMETGKWKYAILSGICIMSMAFEEFHLVYYSALFTAAFLLYKAISVFIGKKHGWKGSSRKFVYLTLVIVIFWVLAVGYIMYVKQIVFEPSKADAGREIGEIRLFAPEGSDFFRRVNRDSEKFIYPGIISIFLVLFAFGKNIRKIKWFYLTVFLVTAILSLGPNLRFFPLYNFFYKFVPFFGYPRSTARIIVFAFLSISVLSGFGVENILRWNRGKMIAVIALIFLILDFHPLGRIGLCKLNKGNEVYEYIKKDEEGVLLEIPLWPGDSSWSSIYEYYATIYHMPMINGYSSFVTRDYIENVFWPLVSINMGCLNREQYEKLRKLDVRYIILHEEAYPQKVSPFPFDIALRNMKHCPFARFVMEDGPLYLFELKSDFQGDYETQYSLPSKMGIFYECEYLPSRAGEVSLDVDASNGKARYGCESKGDEICLVFGPYQLFPPGKYKLIFRMKGKGISSMDEFARIEVTASKGEEIISQRVIKGADIIQRAGSYGDYELPFEISRLKELEFRVIWFGKGEIWADYIYLLFQEEKDPVLSYEAEDMFHRAFAHGKAAIHPPHRLVYGGTRRYARGSYVASFRLKVAERVEKTVATIRVLLSGSGVILAEKKVSGTDFEEAEKYQEIELPFTLRKMGVLDFEVFFEKVADIWVDRIEMATVEHVSETFELRVDELRSGLLRFAYKGVDFSGMPEVSVVKRPRVYYSRKRKHEQFSVIWLGYLKIDREGEYRIGALSDDGSWIYVDGKEIVDNGGSHEARFVEGKVYLSCGFHHLMVKYFAGGGDELFRLYWMESGKWPVTVPIGSTHLFYLPGDTP